MFYRERRGLLGREAVSTLIPTPNPPAKKFSLPPQETVSYCAIEIGRS